MATPIPMKRGWKKYDIPDLAGAQQAIGSQLIDGRLRKPLVDFITAEGTVEQRVSIFEGGLVVVNMTGASTIRKKLLIPDSALQSYVAAVSAKALDAIDQHSLVLPELTHHSLLRIYDAGGKYVQSVFNPTRVLPKALNDQITPLRDLLAPSPRIAASPPAWPDTSRTGRTSSWPTTRKSIASCASSTAPTSSSSNASTPPPRSTS